MAIIDINRLTKDYGNRRGIFDLTLAIQPGETFGLVGANGAGKTTTIRHLMGFLKPDAGSAAIGGLDCWKDAATIKKQVGYVPGEIAFPDAPTGTAFLQRQAELLQLKDMSLAQSLIETMQLDPTANLKRMSKGMKQKTAIVAAFMADPDILILDEPTTGLDPLMRAAFLDLLAEEKQKGKTIFMSTHMLEEVEQICDRVAFIKDGRIIAVQDTKAFTDNGTKVYELDFQSREQLEHFVSHAPFTPVDPNTNSDATRSTNRETDGDTHQATDSATNRDTTRETNWDTNQDVDLDTDHDTHRNATQNRLTIQVHDRDINRLLTTLTSYNLKSFSEVKRSLEEEIIRIIQGGNAHVQQNDL